MESAETVFADVIAENAKSIRARVEAAAARAGRDPSGVGVIAVSKTKPASDVRAAYYAGFRAFGENHTREIVEKSRSNECGELPDIEWHMIGHLQTNKVKQIAGRTALIHSVDRFSLAEELQKTAKKIDTIVNVLIQVNVAGEVSKSGFSAEEAPDAISAIAGFSNLRIRGLMTIAPFTSYPGECRPFFRELRRLSLDTASKRLDNVDMCILSMGMSNDFEVAIEEGASLIRIGTLLFGKR